MHNYLYICIHANPRSSKIGRRPKIFRDSQQNSVSNGQQPPRAVELGLYFGLQWGGGGGGGGGFSENKKAVISVQSFTKCSIFIVDVKKREIYVPKRESGR